MAKVAIKSQSGRGEAWPAPASDFTASDFSICHEPALLEQRDAVSDCRRDIRASRLLIEQKLPLAHQRPAYFSAARTYVRTFDWVLSDGRTIAPFLQFAARAVSGDIRPQNCVFGAGQTASARPFSESAYFPSSRTCISELIYVNFQSFKD